ncbi:MAG: PilN domain-containing protein [Deltaproteobacteria bacterium]|jgi:Tfp pilus assembly protein PilN|nr:PilN domain-containing protein [Deltaproteobacteria bacterium]
MMIKINLLPIEAFRQAASGQLSVTIFAFVMVACGVGLFLYKTAMMDTKITALRAERDAQSARYETLKKDAEEALKETTQFTAQLIKADAIAELEERRRDQTRLLDSIANEVINQASWLTSVSHEKGLVPIRGMATDHEVVAAYLSKLERLPILKNVDLIRAARDTTINNIRLVTFEIRGETAFPPASLMEAGLTEVNLPAREEIVRLVSAAAPTLGDNLSKSRETSSSTL